MDSVCGREREREEGRDYVREGEKARVSVKEKEKARARSCERECLPVNL